MVENLVVVAAYDDKYIADCLKSLGDKYPVQVMDTSSGGYPSGAYIKAFEKYKAHNYLFLQDTLRALTPDYLEPFAAKLPEQGATAWAWFREGFDTADQENWAKSIYDGEYPGVGIFGPIFYISRKSLLKLRRLDLLPPVPTNKAEAQTTERLWSWALYNAGMRLSSVGGWWDDRRMKDGTYPIFQKIFAGRT